MINLFWIATGGAIGASLRYFISNIMKSFIPNLPIGTLFINILGSFLIGFAMSYLENKNISENFIKYFFVIGLLGSFTTFSAFSFEIVDMYNNHKLIIPFLYILLSVSCCVLAAFLGYNLNRI